MMRTTSKCFAVAATVCSLAIGASATPAMASASAPRVHGPATPKNASTCKGATVKPVVHNDAVRREATLTALVAKLQAHTDRYGSNGSQIAALQAARAAIVALDGQIAQTCYPTLAALKSDSSKLFVDYRVYWLRVPQTNVLVAADSLAGARAHLASAAVKLAPLVGSNPKAQADLAAMNSALADAAAKLGSPPNPGPAIAPVAGLLPVADMTQDTAVLQAAHTDLVAASAAIRQARADGLDVVTDLRS